MSIRRATFLKLLALVITMRGIIILLTLFYYIVFYELILQVDNYYSLYRALILVARLGIIMSSVRIYYRRTRINTLLIVLIFLLYDILQRCFTSSYCICIRLLIQHLTIMLNQLLITTYMSMIDFQQLRLYYSYIIYRLHCYDQNDLFHCFCYVL